MGSPSHYPTLHYGDMPQIAVLGADFAPLKVPARDLGGLTTLLARMGVIRLFVCARARLRRRIRLAAKPPVAPSFVRCARGEAELRAAKNPYRMVSHHLELI
jgi:hypothetical protein